MMNYIERIYSKLKQQQKKQEKIYIKFQNQGDHRKIKKRK